MSLQSTSETDPTAAPLASIGEPSFADQVRGQAPKPIDLTLSMIMSDLYDGTGVPGWAPLDAAQLQQAGIDPAGLQSDETGFKAMIYGDGSGHYVVAYSGTDEAKDWLTNLRQGLGIEDKQYNQAIELAQKAHVAFGDNVVITGHSLGGGLAGAAAMVSGIPAVTFNASGVHDKTIERFGLDAGMAKADAEDGLVRRYAVQHEILTHLQEKSIPLKWAMPDAVGHKIELHDPDPLSFWQKLNPVNDVRHAVDLHYIRSVIKAQHAQAGELGYEIDPAAKAAIAVPEAKPVAPLLSHPEHPDNRLYEQSLHGLRGLDARVLGYRDEQDYRNAAGSVASLARTSGFTQIDHLVASRDGAGVFAVDGRMDDPAHRRIYVDAAQAATQPLDQSTARLHDTPQQAPEAQPDRVQRSNALA